MLGRHESLRFLALSQEPESLRAIEPRGKEVRIGAGDPAVSAESAFEIPCHMERD